MLIITWRCYCSHKEVESKDDGKLEVTKVTYDCELSCCSSAGAYNKSHYWSKERDEEDAHKVRHGMAYSKAMENVKPLKKDKRRAA